jgi:hypothetical protein
MEHYLDRIDFVNSLVNSSYKQHKRWFYATDGTYFFDDWASLFKNTKLPTHELPPNYSQLIPAVTRRSIVPSQKTLKNTLLYRYIQHSYEYVINKGLDSGISRDTVESIFKPQISSVFEVTSDEDVTEYREAKKIPIISGNITQISTRNNASISSETKTSLINEYEFDTSSGKVGSLGAEAYAVYLPIHFFYNGDKLSTDWGIYISEKGILKLSLAIREICINLCGEPIVGIEKSDRIFNQIAYQTLLRHEMFHFRIEFFTLHAELLTARSIYIPYISNVFSKTRYTDDCLEEAFANIAVLNSDIVKNLFVQLYAPEGSKNKVVPNWHDVIRFFFDKQPAGYRNYHLQSGWPVHYHRHTEFKERQRAMNYFCNQIITGEVRPNTDDVPFYAFPPDNFFLKAENLVPINIVQSLGVNETVIAPAKSRVSQHGDKDLFSQR